MGEFEGNTEPLSRTGLPLKGLEGLQAHCSEPGSVHAPGHKLALPGFFPLFLASQMKHISVGGTGRAPALGIKGHVGCLGKQWWEQKPRCEDSKVMMAGEAQSL